MYDDAHGPPYRPIQTKGIESLKEIRSEQNSRDKKELNVKISTNWWLVFVAG